MLEIGRGPRCDCSPGHCASFVEPDSRCIFRLSGDVQTMNCKACDPNGIGTTWHQDGECLRCRAMA